MNFNEIKNRIELAINQMVDYDFIDPCDTSYQLIPDKSTIIGISASITSLLLELIENKDIIKQKLIGVHQTRIEEMKDYVRYLKELESTYGKELDNLPPEIQKEKNKKQILEENKVDVHKRISEDLEIDIKRCEEMFKKLMHFNNTNKWMIYLSKLVKDEADKREVEEAKLTKIEKFKKENPDLLILDEKQRKEITNELNEIKAGIKSSNSRSVSRGVRRPAYRRQKSKSTDITGFDDYVVGGAVGLAAACLL